MPTSAPLAAIDIGTNTFRFLIAHVTFSSASSSYSLHEICSGRVVTRLGEGITRRGRLNSASITKGIAVLREFNSIIQQHQVRKVSAVATSALREARNSDVFLRKAREEAGLNIRIISGAEEAKRTASGMLIDIPLPATALMIDIGGGSTELIYMVDASPVLVRSIGLGVVHLAKKYMRQDPPAPHDLEQMDMEITGKLGRAARPFMSRIEGTTSFIGTAGTITALTAMSRQLDRYEHEKIHRSRLSRKKIGQIYTEISRVSSRERALLIPFEPSRLDIIVPGTRILQRLMDICDFSNITVSAYGLKEGILIDLYKKHSGKLRKG